MVSSLGLIVPVGILLSISCFVVASTALVGELGDSVVLRHIASIALGCMLGFAVWKMPYKKILKLGPVLLGASIVLLAAVLIVGKTSGGATRWLSFAGFTFQPSELAKLALVIYLAGYVQRQKDNLSSFKASVLVPGGILLVMVVLLLLQPDFGSSVIVSLLTGIVLFIFIPLRYSILAALTGVGVFSAALVLSPYRMKRLTAFLDPFDDPTGSGYQLIQSLIAVGRGGLSGVGIGMSEQKLSYLPAAHTDFLYAVLSEELGFFGAFFVLTMYLSIGLWALKQARSSEAEAGKAALTLGLGALLVIPAFLNIAVVVGVLPTKGLTLPLMSFGGSSMLVSIFAMFILLSAAREE